MDHIKSQIDELKRQLTELGDHQFSLQQKISELRSAIEQLEIQLPQKEGKEEAVISSEVPESETSATPYELTAPQEEMAETIETLATPTQKEQSINAPAPRDSNYLERLIGENLINKIGILILVLGVGIGIKYVVDNDLINPLTRIVLGYLTGIGLGIIALRLKDKFLNYSAVILSGALAILYFTTYFAYSSYALIPQVFAFFLMLLFTAFSSLAAIKYDKQIIAGLGLVGAYSIPFLLSPEEGNPVILFSYMSLVNLGILSIAIFKLWKLIYVLAFFSSWFIFLIWFVDVQEKDYWVAHLFSFFFFAIFYGTFLIYKVRNHLAFAWTDVFFLSVNALIYFLVNYYILDREATADYVGLFTLFNASIHALVAFLLFQRKSVDRSLILSTVGLVIVFITIAFPIQFDGHWVTLFWMVEAVILLVISKRIQTVFYEYASYLLLVFGSISLLQDWYIFYPYNDESKNFWNAGFLSFIYAVVPLGLFNYINASRASSLINNGNLRDILKALAAIAFIGVLYFGFYNEIALFWNKKGAIDYPTPFYLKSLWSLCYSLVFIGLLLLVYRFYKPREKVIFQSMLTILALGSFCYFLIGIPGLYHLRMSYFDGQPVNYFLVRYVLVFVFLGLLYISYISLRDHFDKKQKEAAIFIYGLMIAIVATDEYISIMDLNHVRNALKWGITIFLGCLSLAYILIGIFRKIQSLRWLGLLIFALVILKIFLYDSSELSSGTKTITYISLGALLLIASYMYNRFQSKIFDSDEKS